MICIQGYQQLSQGDIYIVHVCYYEIIENQGSERVGIQCHAVFQKGGSEIKYLSILTRLLSC